MFGKVGRELVDLMARISLVVHPKQFFGVHWQSGSGQAFCLAFSRLLHNTQSPAGIYRGTKRRKGKPKSQPIMVIKGKWARRALQPSDRKAAAYNLLRHRGGRTFCLKVANKSTAILKAILPMSYV